MIQLMVKNTGDGITDRLMNPQATLEQDRTEPLVDEAAHVDVAAETEVNDDQPQSRERRVGRVATDRYQPIRQPEVPGSSEASDSLTQAATGERRAVSRFGGQTMLDTMRDRIKSIRRSDQPAIRTR